MVDGAKDAKPIIVCPLRFEAAALRRAGLAQSCDLVCSGPGEQGIHAWGESANIPAGRKVLLAGLAGGLTARCGKGRAFAASCIVMRGGERATPFLTDEESRSAIIATSPQVLASREEKAAFARTTGADLVDQESEAFAILAAHRGWMWGVVRGVSDDMGTSLPVGLETWVNECGGTRVMRVAMSLLSGAVSLREVRRLGADSREAMAAVAERLCCLLEC
ncbi:MAG TPA: hypothetical protein PK098_12980 [Phycisphaerales bacterium]|nr:hypothetical protein [Phycisphaerales bacterium]